MLRGFIKFPSPQRSMARKITVRQALRRSGLFDKTYDMEQAIKAGKVTYNSKPVQGLQFHFDSKDCLFFEGTPVRLLKKQYFVLNKPFQTSCQKHESQKFVVDVLDVDPKVRNSLFPVGRLDVPTTGLLIITNDGVLSKELLDPKSKIAKTYKVMLKRKLSDEAIKKLEYGVVIEVQGKDYTTLPCEIKRIPGTQSDCFITITEGKHRQIRKMFKGVDNAVMNLSRTAIGGLTLEEIGLTEGNYKEITFDELTQKIKKKVKVKSSK